MLHRGIAPGGSAATTSHAPWLAPTDVRRHHRQHTTSLSNHPVFQAFTYRNHVFFGRDQYQPRHRRRAAARWPTSSPTRSSRAPPSSASAWPAPEVLRKAETPPPVTTSGPTPAVQRLGHPDDAATTLADQAHHIPGFRMLTLCASASTRSTCAARSAPPPTSCGPWIEPGARRRADHPGPRHPRRDQPGRRVGGAEGRHARRHRRPGRRRAQALRRLARAWTDIVSPARCLGPRQADLRPTRIERLVSFAALASSASLARAS